jgi:drug/metabolite transporter (DMT)-like permease
VGVLRRKGYLVEFLLLTTVLVWGFNFALMKSMYRYFHPIAFNAIRFAVASVTMLLLLKIRGQSARVDREDFRGVLWLGFLGNTLYPFVFVLGLDRTTAGNAALLMALTPIFAFLIGVAMKKERFSPGVLTGIVLSLAGVAVIVLFGSNAVSFASLRAGGGDLLMIAAAALWGWQSAEATRLLPKYGPLRLTVSAMIAGTACMIPLSIPWLTTQNFRGIPPIAWLGLGYSALLSIAYAYFVWAYALSTIGVAHTAVFNNVTPIVAMLAGWLLLNETPALAQFAGVVLVLVGVFMVRSRKPSAVPDE